MHKEPCEEIEDVSASEIVLDAQLQLFDKITTKEIDQALILFAREKIEKELNYSCCRTAFIKLFIQRSVQGRRGFGCL